MNALFHQPRIFQKKIRPQEEGFPDPIRYLKNGAFLVVTSRGETLHVIFHRIHVWYICLHLVNFYGKCREIYHTWILWVFYHILKLGIYSVKSITL